MKNVLKVLFSGLAALVLFVGCSKQPTQEIETTKMSIESVMSDGAEKYAAEEAKSVNDEYNAAMDEIKAQDGKFLKNYDKAREMLAKAKTDSENLKSGLAAKKEEAKNNAIAAQEAANTAVNEAQALLSKAPKGKGTSADLAAMAADVKALEESLPEVQQAIDSEEYAMAAEKANTIKDKATGVTDQITQALEKVGPKKK
jgi:ABC-type transporter Mla subunit MlaD